MGSVAWPESGESDLWKGHGWTLCKMALFTVFLVKRLAVIYFHIPNWRALKVPSKSMFSSLSQPVTYLSVPIKLLTWIMQMRFCCVQHPSLFISTTAETSSRPLAYTVWFQHSLGQDLSTSGLDLCHNHLTNRPDPHKSWLSSKVTALYTPLFHCFDISFSLFPSVIRQRKKKTFVSKECFHSGLW